MHNSMWKKGRGARLHPPVATGKHTSKVATGSVCSTRTICQYVTDRSEIKNVSLRIAISETHIVSSFTDIIANDEHMWHLQSQIRLRLPPGGMRYLIHGQLASCPRTLMSIYTSRGPSNWELSADRVCFPHSKAAV